MTLFEADDVRTLPGECGSHTFMYRGAGLAGLRRAFNRDNIAAKIHHRALRWDEGPEQYVWGYHYLPPAEQTPLIEALTIQNVYAALGLAPRVYGLATWQDEFGQRHPVQVTEDLGCCDWGQPPQLAYDLFDRIVQLAGEYGFIAPGRDSGVHNYVAGKWVDFNGFRFGPDYYQQLMDRFWRGTQWGDRPYQQVLQGSLRNTCRDMQVRITDLGLDRLDFSPRHVLDVGCSGGQFLNYLNRQYGARGTGYDTPRAVLSAAEFSATAGAWNVDYYSADLREQDAVEGQYDLVLFLSVSRHIGLPEYVKQCASKRLIIEAHDEHREAIEPWLGDEFEIVHQQVSVDYGRRVYHAERRTNGREVNVGRAV